MRNKGSRSKKRSKEKKPDKIGGGRVWARNKVKSAADRQKKIGMRRNYAGQRDVNMYVKETNGKEERSFFRRNRTLTDVNEGATRVGWRFRKVCQKKGDKKGKREIEREEGEGGEGKAER